jgi:hypothetical protein
MRKAIFAAVVAVHIALVWYFLTLRHVEPSDVDVDEPSMTMIFLTPTELDVPRRRGASGRAELGERSDVASHQGSASQAPLLQTAPTRVPPSPESPSQLLQSPAPWSLTAPVGPSLSSPDWRTEAEIVAQTDAQHIVESEDQAGVICSRTCILR